MVPYPDGTIPTYLQTSMYIACKGKYVAVARGIVGIVPMRSMRGGLGEAPTKGLDTKLALDIILYKLTIVQ